MTAILGVSAFYHDSAAALVVDGNIIAAAQEERFTRKKHDAAFPTHSIDYCLEEGGLKPKDLDVVVYYERPGLKFHRLAETYLAFAPRGLNSFLLAAPEWLGKKLFLARQIRKGLPGLSRAAVNFVQHHKSHAASAFFPSPFEHAAILTVDGVGEWTTTAIGYGDGNHLRLTHELNFPHSLGLLYSAFAAYCGLKVNSGEYKLMGLAPYGRPVYEEVIRNCLINIKEDGSFWINMRYFSYCHGLTMTNRHFHDLFGGPPRRSEADIEQRHMNIAASIQAVTEDIVLRIGNRAHRLTGKKNLVMAGGVALNCVANGRLLREGPFDAIWVQPAAGDAGGALGAALFHWYQTLGKSRGSESGDRQKGSLLGPAFDNTDVCSELDRIGAVYECVTDEATLSDRIASYLAEEKVVGWFQGRMEFGPRALGARSILGDPRSPRMQATMNLKVKFREIFRPFAPAVLEEHASDWFDMGANKDSPYMLFVFPVREERRLALSDHDQHIMEHDPDLRSRLNVLRSIVPSITHVDYTARVQTVKSTDNLRLHSLLTAFYRRTGCPLLVNTSFNVRGEPIVCTPADAYRCFIATNIDVLVIENCVLTRGNIPPSEVLDANKYLLAIEPD